MVADIPGDIDVDVDVGSMQVQAKFVEVDSLQVWICRVSFLPGRRRIGGFCRRGTFVLVDIVAGAVEAGLWNVQLQVAGTLECMYV